MHRILDLFFSPHVFRDVLPDVWSGFQTNIHMMIIAEILVLIFALGIAVVRGLPGRAAIPLRALAILYVDFFTVIVGEVLAKYLLLSTKVPV